MDIGITAFGGYIPRLRLSRESIINANAWVDPTLLFHDRSERSMCDADEDSITMAVEAARDCLNDGDRENVTSLYFATTTAPFDDRQNSSIIASALRVRDDIVTLDVSHSQRAGTSGLITALKAEANNGNGTTLYLAADHRQAKSASVQELLFGDGAAALSLGTENVIARFLGSHSISRDLVDHYRGQGDKYDYQWEERWVREEGYFKMVPEAIQKLLEKTGISATDVNHFVMPCLLRGVREKAAHKMGFTAEAVRNDLQAGCGETGTAHPLVMLVDTLQDAQPKQKILVIGFGQGVDALLFETTAKLGDLPFRNGIKGALADGTVEKNYQKFLSFSDRVDIHWGMRAESITKPRLTAAYRDRKMLSGLTGGKCKQCGTVQFPAAHICVNPECRATDTQEDYPLAESTAKIASYTVDWLAYTPNPPLIFGMVEFEEGAKFMMQMTGFDHNEVDVGLPVKMVFRIKHYDKARNFRTYFWKAASQSNSK